MEGQDKVLPQADVSKAVDIGDSMPPNTASETHPEQKPSIAVQEEEAPAPTAAPSHSENRGDPTEPKQEGLPVQAEVEVDGLNGPQGNMAPTTKVSEERKEEEKEPSTLGQGSALSRQAPKIQEKVVKEEIIGCEPEKGGSLPQAEDGNDSDLEVEGVDLDDDDEDMDEGENEMVADAGKAEGSQAPSTAAAPPVEQGGAGGGEVAAAAAAAAASGAPEGDEEVEAARKEHEDELRRLREAQEAEEKAAAAGQAMNKEKRLAFLMKQSEIFTHFLSEGGMLGSGAGKGKSGGRRNRISEAEEDKMMMKAATSKSRATRLLEQPASIVNGTMRPYQLEGLNWMITLYDNGISGILADEMGLGKTLQSISLLAYLREAHGVAGPHLVVVPKSTLGNWMKEFAQWCPSLRAVKMIGTKEQRARVLDGALRPGGCDVLVTSYEALLRERGRVARVQWKYLVIDEAHRIKNENSSLSQAVRTFKTQFRLLITGTPLQNNLHELWALLNFLLPDVFSSSEDFDRWFDVEGSEDQRRSAVAKLHTVLRPFMLRRVKADVAKDLPPKTETKLFVGLSDLQRQWYASLLQKDAAALNALGGPTRSGLLNILMQLRKVCNHPYLFEGAEPGPPYEDGPHLWESCGKMAVLHKLLPKLKAQGSRVLIFCQMVRQLDIIEDYLRYNEYEYGRIDGSTAGEDRDSLLQAYNAPGSPLFAFLLSTRAGGLGINLQTADTVVLYDSDWNPQVDLQAMDRAHRIGQTRPVNVFRLITEGTVEEKIVERADKKLFLDAAVIQQGRLAQQHAKLSNQELGHMVRFGADAIMSAKKGTLTDEDIDALLRRSTARTAALSAKFRTDVQHSLADFTLDGKEDSSCFFFEGEDYREEAGKRKKVQSFIQLPQRERRQNYNENEYFRGALNPNGPPTKKKKKLRRVVTHDFQFFDDARLDELHERERVLFDQEQELRAKVRELRQQEQWLRRQGEVADPNGLAPGALADQLEAALPRLRLPDEERAEKERLLAAGFGHWTRQDFRVYLAALERNGRADLASIREEVSAEIERPPEDVAAYHKRFMERKETLKDWPRLKQRLDRGEQKIRRRREIKEAIRGKVEQYENPERSLTLDYQGKMMQRFSRESDAFLVNAMHKFGFENWHRIKLEIRDAWQFKFDWFLRTRSEDDIARRCLQLIGLIEAENQAGGKKKRSKSSGGSSSKQEEKKSKNKK